MLEDEPKVLHGVAGPHVNEVMQNHACSFCQTLLVFFTHTHFYIGHEFHHSVQLSGRKHFALPRIFFV